MNISKDVAEKEFTSWFEAKKLPIHLLEKNNDDKEAIIGAIMEGKLILNEDFTFTQKLVWPIQITQESEKISELIFAFRVSEGVLSASLHAIKTDDLIGQMALAYIATLTGHTKSIIKLLDPVDSYIGKKIAAFFFI